MSAAPLPSHEETRANATFDALLWALSRPGKIRILPEQGEGPMITALLDRECRVYSADPLLVPDIMRAGAEIAPIEKADHVFMGALQAVEDLQKVQTGSDLYPDDGATVVVRAQIGQGQGLRLSGPGVDGTLDLQLAGLPEGFWAARNAQLRYPMGFDLFILDGHDVIGVPRSTTVEVL